MRPRSRRITGNMRGSKPVKMSTREPAACSLATAGSKSAASVSTSSPRRMSLPPAARLTRSGAISTALGTCSAATWPSSFPRMARLAYRNAGRSTARAAATISAQPRSPPPGPWSSSPSVKLSPIATNVSITGPGLLSGIPSMMPRSGERPLAGLRGSRTEQTVRMRMRLGAPILARAVLAAGLLAAAAACSGSAGTGGGTSSGAAPSARTLSPPPSGEAAGAHPDAAWTTFGRDFARSGVAAGVAAPGGPGSLKVGWHARLDGAVYGQPLLVGSMAIAATENDSLYGLDQASGKVLWRTHVGTPVPRSALPCGNIDPLGITSTPVYDPSSGIVYAVAETSGYHHVLVGLSVTDGRLAVERDIPTPDGQPRYDQQRPALTLQGGRVYVAFGGLAGDCGPYRGSVVGVPVSGSGALISYVVPTPREGAIWAPGGPVTGPDGTLYVSVGNGSESSTSFDDSD